MPDQTRRGFLTLAGASAAAVGAATIATSAVGMSAAGAAPATPGTPGVPNDITGPLMAYVRDPRAGEVAVMVGEREVVVQDYDLAARIAHAAR